MYENENNTNNGYYNESDNNGSYYNSPEQNGDSGYYNNAGDNTNGYYGNSGNDNPNSGKKKNNKKKTPVIIAVVVVCAVILVAALAVTVTVAYKDINSTDIVGITENKESATEKSDYEDIGSTNITTNTGDSTSGNIMVTDVSGVVDETIPSIVAITSTTLKESSYDYYNYFFDEYFGGNGNNNRQGETYEEQAAGSGIIVDQTDSELLIVTNNHVVEGADSLEVQFYGQSEDDTVKGYIKGTDSSSDVAVVAVKLSDISKDIRNNIKKATLGDSDSVKVGEGVIAIGNALGFGQSVTTGIISAKDREAAIEDKTMTLLQTDAAINGGNSGGALINSKGEVIGINIAKYSSSDSGSASIEGMGFAIPISSVKNIISNLETKETREKVSDDEKGYLGLNGYEVTEELSRQYGLPIGLCIQTVVKGSPAEKAGIRQYDVITKFDDQTVTSMESLQNIMAYYKAGEKVKVTVAYNSGQEYKEKDITITLGDKSVVEDN